MIETFSGHISLKEIWPGLLFSILFHSALVALFLFAPSANSPGDQRCFEVRLVSLAVGGNRDASGPERGAENTVEFRRAEAIPEEQRNVVSNPATGKATDRPKSKHTRKTCSPSPQAPEQPAGPEVGLGTSEAQVDAGLPEQPASQEEGSGKGAAGSSGNGTEYALGTSEAGQGATLSNGPIDARLGSANGPRFLHRVLPRYPRLARERGKEGSVLLRVTIDQQGRPVDVELLKKAGSEFDDEAVRAVEGSTFAPARLAGRPVICKVLLPVRFELRDSEDD
ncbi:MAG: TonB family protein [Syntrophobacteraceae bacterium]